MSTGRRQTRSATTPAQITPNPLATAPQVIGSAVRQPVNKKSSSATKNSAALPEEHVPPVVEPEMPERAPRTRTTVAKTAPNGEAATATSKRATATTPASDAPKARKRTQPTKTLQPAVTQTRIQGRKTTPSNTKNTKVAVGDVQEAPAMKCAKTKAEKKAEAKEAREKAKERLTEVEAEIEEEWEEMEKEDPHTKKVPQYHPSEEIDIESASSNSNSETDADEVEDSDDETEIDEQLARERRLEELQAEMLALKSKASKKKGKGKRKTQSTLPLASGLLPEFRVETSLEAEATPTVTVNESGGLDDDDIADEERPPPQKSNRRDKVVAIAFPTSKLPPKPPFPAATKTSARPPLIQATTPNPITPTTRLPAVQPAKVKKVISAESSLARLSGNTDTSSDRKTTTKSSKKGAKERSESPTPSRTPKAETALVTITSSNVRREDLPDFLFVGNRYKLHFLPTLTFILYTDTVDPFKAFTLYSQSLNDSIQHAIDAVYPNVEYMVRTHSDAVHCMSYNRINDRRSFIARRAVDLIQDRLKQFSNTTDAQGWLAYSRRLKDGPLFFAYPTPAHCVVKRGHPNYIEPGGRLKSSFVLALARDALEFSENAVPPISGGFLVSPPVGLFALILTSLERAVFGLNADGTRTAQMKAFSDENYGRTLSIYLSTLQHFDKARWQELLADCLSTNEDDPGASLDADRSLVDVERHEIFSFESPRKQRT